MELALRIRRFLEEEVVFGELKLGDDESLFANGALDSISFVNLIQFLENEFGIRFRRSEFLFENFETVAKMVQMVEQKRAEGKA